MLQTHHEFEFFLKVRFWGHIFKPIWIESWAKGKGLDFQALSILLDQGKMFANVCMFLWVDCDFTHSILYLGSSTV